MSSRDDDIFMFDSLQEPSKSEIESINLLENINLTADSTDNLVNPLNYQTTRRIEQAEAMLKDRSLLTLHSIQTGESICLIRAKLLAKLSPFWSSEIENKIFEQSEFDEIPSLCDYTIVTPSTTFIEFDNVRSFACSFSTVNNSYSYKSPDRMKFNKI